MELTGNKYTRTDWRKFLATRRGTVMVAGACALLAAAILIFAMQRYRHSISTEGNPETVFVATQEIQSLKFLSIISAACFDFWLRA